MTTYPFLSPEWIDAARAIHEANHDESDNTPSITMNLVITDAPFGDGKIGAYVDSTDGGLAIELGALEHAEVTLTLGYAVAKSIFIEGDTGAGMRAFLAGRIRVEGNMAKLLALQGTRTDNATRDKLRAITAS